MGTLHICMAREIWGAIVPARFYCEPKNSINKVLNLCSWGTGIVLHALNLSTHSEVGVAEASRFL